MNDELFDWDDANVGHIAEHDVVPEEAEEIILADPIELGFDAGVEGEPGWTYVGQTSATRILLVVITVRHEKVRVVTAFEPIKRIKTSYHEAKAAQQ